MASVFHFTITTPDKALFNGDVAQVTLPSAQGQITVLAHHEPLVSVIVPGELIVKDAAGASHIFAVSKGFLEVQADNTVQLLANTAETLEEIDEQRAEEAKRNAEALMSQRLGDEEIAETSALLERNLNRLKIIRKHRTRHMPHVE